MTSPSTPRVEVGNIAARIEDELREAGEPARAEQEKRYLKTDLQHYGASVPAIRTLRRRSPTILLFTTTSS